MTSRPAMLVAIGALALGPACRTRQVETDAFVGLDVEFFHDAHLDAWDQDTPRRADVGPVDATCAESSDAVGVVCEGDAAEPDVDLDRDGFTPAEGDCSDCSPQVNPGALDDPGNDVDEDCDGVIAREPLRCDDTLSPDSSDPLDAARALGLCRLTRDGERGWGLVSARWTRADGTGVPIATSQHALLTSFGATAGLGSDPFLALSSGVAGGIDPTDVEHGSEPEGGLPPGLLIGARGCPVDSIDVYDPVALELRVRVPTNARGFRFVSNFFTREYPDYVCTEYNDYYAALMRPAPTGSVDGNVVFDVDGNRITVNSSLLAACSPGVHGARAYECPLGPGPLAGTGYDMGGSTGWLVTEVPIDETDGGEITLRFAIWDSNDARLDSLVLIDDLEWLFETPCAATEPLL